MTLRLPHRLRAGFRSGFDADWGATMAASSLFAIPILIVFLCFLFDFLQRSSVGGLTAGAVKGQRPR